MKRLAFRFAVPFLALTPVAATAQLQVISSTGDFRSFGTSLNPDDVFTNANLYSSGGSSSFSIRGRNFTDSDPYGARGFARFTAVDYNHQDGVQFLLPSDNAGNTSGAADGEVRKFLTHDSSHMASFFKPGITFNGSITGDSSNDGEIAVDFFSAGYSLGFKDTALGWLSIDNSGIDLDPTTGVIKIDKSVNPTATTQATSRTYDVARNPVFDGDSNVLSPFYDGLFLSTDVRITGDGVNMGYSTGFSPILHTWAPGDDTTPFTNASYTGNVNFNLASLAVGDYTITTQDIVWQSLGWTDGLFSDYYPGNGFYGTVSTYRLSVVPEPGTMALLALGVGALVARRRKG